MGKLFWIIFADPKCNHNYPCKIGLKGGMAWRRGRFDVKRAQGDVTVEADIGVM